MKFNLIKQLMFLSIMLFTSVIFAQTVTGTVTGDGGPLPGVSVFEKGTTNGTASDFDGKYSLTLTNADAVLVYSFMGFLTQEINVNGQGVINVVLEVSAESLDEVIIVGYGSQTKKEITSSVVQLDEKAFNKGVVNSAVGLLQGKVAGLTISNRGGDPNSSGAIRLRGISTIGANTEPLIVVDGLIGGSMSNIDPNDILSINVLKDGSAAAIYGTRGSSGVILIVTKKGGSRESSFEYSSQLEVSSITRTVDNMSASEFLAVGGFDLGNNTNWIDEVTRTGISKVNNFAVSGGSDRTNYRISANIRNVEGILNESGFDKMNVRANLNTKILNDKVNVSFNSSYTKKNSQFGFYEALRYAVLYNPTAPIYGVDSPFQFNSDQYGGYFQALGLFDSFNPVAIVEQNKNNGVETQFNYILNLKSDLTDNLTANVSVSEQFVRNNNVEYYPTTSHFRGMAAGAIRKGLARFYNSSSEIQQFETYLTYNNEFDKSNLTVTGGYSFQQSNFNDNFLEIGDFPGDNLDYSNAIENSQDLLEAGFIKAESGASPDDRIIAFFGRVNYTFDDALFFMASVRHEGSTKLGVDNQWGTFPAFGLGADLNKYLELDNVELLKVRVGYGVTGAIPGANGLSKEIRNIVYDSSTGAASTTLARAANPDLKWEEKAETNIGIEFSTNRFNATLDLYTRDVKDFIIERTVDVAEFGVDRRYENAGKLNTKGVELIMNYDFVKKDDFTYNSGIVFSTYKSVLDEYVVESEMRANLGSPGQNSTNMILVREGEQIGQIWGPVFSGNVVDGAQVFVDINGDGNLVTNQDQALNEDADFAVLGNGIPDFELGWTNQLSYKNWEVNAFFRGAFGHSLVNTFRAFFEPRVGSQTGYNYVNTELADPAITSAQFSSLYVEKADFFKLDNLSIGYNFDLSENTQKYFKSIKVSLSGQNVFTITNYTGNDPEPALQDFGGASNGDFTLSTPDPLSPGIDRRNNYFNARKVSLGVLIKL
ncbi:MAG: SusC/RagA family TonB-linked outer membrane protein [Lutibacter sp.]|nr:MAG: SusC/RagA family TonB-linked outer membrane protein [Lutibacter sp.]